MPRAILLDLDGTLIDSRPGIGASCAAALQALGHVPDPALDITTLIGPPLPEVIRRLLLHHGDDRVEQGITAYRAHYGTIGMHQATLYPGIAYVVDNLAATGARCFVATSKRTIYAAQIVQAQVLAPCIQAVYGTDPDGSLDDKAHLIAALLRTEGLSASDTIMVGDRSHDIIAAHANGLRAIGVLWGYGSQAELETAGADALATTPADLLTIILSSVPD
jgi:phosphoglycolate phosphatase